ncbi:MAG TPA: hypothetical protein VNF28_04585 [Candidatus Binataceae bacterium]|nr:hypothetical protein [Candidatus Binataceae bacterium]
MKVKSRWLALAASAATLVVFAYGGAALAQVPTGTPGETNPPGWKPHVSYPFRPGHLTPGEEMRLHKPGPGIEAPQGRTGFRAIPISPEDLRKEEEYTRTHGYITVEPPHPANHGVHLHAHEQRELRQPVGC